MEVTVIPIIIDALGTVTIGAKGLGNRRTSGDYPKYSIIKISQNTERSSGDLRKFAVTQNQVKRWCGKLEKNKTIIMIMHHANDEMRKTTHNRINRATKSRKIRTLERKETLKFLRILEVEGIKQV